MTGCVGMLKPTVFLSYKRGDAASEEAVATAEAALVKNGLEVLIDRGIEPGDVWSQELYQWLLSCSAAIAFVGAASAASEWCRREWWFLRERHRADGMPVIQISTDGTWDSAGILDDLQGMRISKRLGANQLKSLRALNQLKPSAESYLAAHHAWLRYQFNNAPLWGREPFSLGDVYVETECGLLDWEEISREKEPRDPFKDDDENGGRHGLLDTAMARILDTTKNEPIVIQGPPGAGKSAFTLRLANELLERGFNPILVRFRDFRPTQADRADQLIDDALRIGPVEEEPPRHDAAIVTPALLDRSEGTMKGKLSDVVLILDGWDEVSLSGNANYQAQLQTWLPKIREFVIDKRGVRARLVLSGRPSSEVRSSGVLHKKTPILTVRSLRPDALTGFAEAMAGHLEGAAANPGPDQWTIDLEHIEPLMRRYKEWFDEDGRTRDTSSSMDVLGSPLLAFLVFRVLADWRGDPAALVEQPTALYQALIDTTVEHAGKGRDEEVKGSVQRGGERLRRLLHRVAAIVTILRQEAVSFTELDHRLTDDPAFQDWYTDGGDLARAVDGDGKAGALDSPLQELVVNFYFKGGNKSLGCEFLHKSFREYLYAEGVVAALLTVSEGKSGPLQDPNLPFWQDFREGTPQHAASRALAHLLAPQWLTPEVKAHLFWLLGRAIEAEPERWVWLRDLLLDVYIWWAEGVHLRRQPGCARDPREWATAFVEEMVLGALPFDSKVHAEPPRSTALDAHLGDALMEITALVHRLLLDRPTNDQPGVGFRPVYRTTGDIPRFKPGGGGHFRNLVARINAAGWRPLGEFPANTSMASVSFAEEALFLLVLVQADLSRADLFEANCWRATIDSCRLQFADLSKSLGLKQYQVDAAYGNRETKLPPRIERPAHWEV